MSVRPRNFKDTLERYKVTLITLLAIVIVILSILTIHVFFLMMMNLNEIRAVYDSNPILYTIGFIVVLIGSLLSIDYFRSKKK